MLDTKMDVKLSKVFRKQYTRASRKVQLAFKDRLRIFEKDPRHPLLRNHLLTGEYRGFRSINITGDWRALYREQASSRGEMLVEFILLGTHSQLYR